VDPKSQYAKKLVPTFRTLNLDLTDLLPPLLQVSPGQVRQQYVKHVKRAEDRVDMKVRALLVGKHGSLEEETDLTENVSSRGLRVISTSEWLLDDTILVALPGFHFTSAARVAYCEPLSAGRFGTGVEFILSEEPAEITVLTTALLVVLELLKRKELARAGCKTSKTAGPGATGQAERRRTPRTAVHIPLFVYGYASADVPYHEEASTITINAQGGLICMQTEVQLGQRLLVTNKANERVQECVVVFVGAQLAAGIAVAFEFPIPMPQFWHDLQIDKSC
jgi:hypothetical protein